MASSSTSPITGFRFGSFELELPTGELRRQGRKIRLQEKPLCALTFLLEHAGEIVSREQLRDHLWPAGTFVEFDDNLNTTIKRIRDALGDSADNPRFVETLPRRGYRFLPPVEVVRAVEAQAAPAMEAERVDTRLHWFGRRTVITAASGLLLVAVIVVGFWLAPRSVKTQANNGRVMMAVLPFRNLSGDPAQEYVSDGTTEELIAHLGRLGPGKLGIISRSSVMRFKGADRDATEIGRELGVDYLIEGSVAPIDGHIRITAQLVQARNRTHLWAETFEGPSTDLLGTERDVARNVAEAVAMRFMPSEPAVLARAATTNTAAYDAYLAGLYYTNRGTRDGFEAALQQFKRAVALDASFAPAHAAAARVYLDLAGYHFIPVDEAEKRAREHVDAALRLDESLPEAQGTNAALLQRENPEAPGIEAAYRRAIALNPSNARVRHDYALYLLNRKSGDSAIAEMHEAVRLDPLSPLMSSDRAWVFYALSRFDESREAVRRALAIDANFPYALYLKGRLSTHAGRLSDAIASYRQAVHTSGRTPKYLHALAEAYARAGLKAEASEMLEELRQQSRTHYVPPEYLQDLAPKVSK